mgnify:CR=1 FL=1
MKIIKKCLTFFLLSVKINIVVYENLKEELMKKFLKSQRGVTLIILVITIIIIAILTGAAIRKMDTGKDIRNYNYCLLYTSDAADD